MSVGIRAEVLFGPMSKRGDKLLRAMLAGAGVAGVEAVRTERYSGDSSRWLVTYGLGEPRRYDAFKAHRAAGGRCVNFDLGYWSRRSAEGDESGGYLLRCSIDAPHPQARLFSVPAGSSRYEAVAGPDLVDRHDPDGPIVIVGMGAKGARWAGVDAGSYEARALAMARDRWPNREVRYRPKVKKAVPYPRVEGFDRVLDNHTIDESLCGASLAVCQHSNAAVDAVRLGIPVLAEDGAVCALVGAGLDREPRIVPQRERERFMHALAWWQWTPQEAAQGGVWRFIRRFDA